MIAHAFHDISQIALAWGSCNFENLKNITRVHISRNALAFLRFSMLIILEFQSSSEAVNTFLRTLNRHQIRDRPPNRELRPLLFSLSVRDEAYGSLSLSQKSRKSKRLQMSLQRQLSYLI